MPKTDSTRSFSFFGPQGMGGGLSSENPIIVSQNQMVVADNILVGTTLSRRKRGGQALYHTGSFDETASFPVNGSVAGLPIRGMLEFFRFDGSGNQQSDLFLHQGASVWSIEERNTVGVDRTGSLDLNASSIPVYQVFNDTVYFVSSDTTDGYNKWDGSTATALSATPPDDGAGKYIRSHKGKMWMAGVADFPFRLYYSTSLDPEDWSSSDPSNGGSLDLIEDGDPGGITAIFPSFQDRLYIATRRSIYELTGDSPEDFFLRPVSQGVGCLSHLSVVSAANDIFFASDRGYHSLRQLDASAKTTSTFLSRDIQRLWTELLNTALYERIYAMYDENTNNILISVPSSGQTKNDQILCYNIEFGTWTVWPNINARSLTKVLIGNKAKSLVGKETGEIALINETNINDFDEGYTARFKTGVLYPGGDQTREKRFTNITVYASTTTQSTFSVGWIIDGMKTGSKVVELNAGSGVLGSTFVLGQSQLGIGQYTPKTITIEDIGYGIQIEIIAGGTSDLEFYGFSLESEDMNLVYR